MRENLNQTMPSSTVGATKTDPFAHVTPIARRYIESVTASSSSKQNIDKRTGSTGGSASREIDIAVMPTPYRRESRESYSPPGPQFRMTNHNWRARKESQEKQPLFSKTQKATEILQGGGSAATERRAASNDSTRYLDQLPNVQKPHTSQTTHKVAGFGASAHGPNHSLNLSLNDSTMRTTVGAKNAKPSPGANFVPGLQTFYKGGTVGANMAGPQLNIVNYNPGVANRTQYGTFGSAFAQRIPNS